MRKNNTQAKGSVKRGLAFLLALAFVFTCVCGCASSVNAPDETEDSSLESDDSSEDMALNWMSRIDDGTYLSDMSIPGTHDSATENIFPAFFLQCQDTSIKEQMENGYRYLDIRLAVEEDDEGNVSLKFIHNFGNCKKTSGLFAEKLYLEDVLSWVYDFLEGNPTETIIFCVKDEGSDDDPEVFEEAFMSLIEENSSVWYRENEIPTLGEVRGKVVLCSRFEDALGYGEGRTGLNFDWEDQNNTEAVDLPAALSMINDQEQLWVQDRYKYNVEMKFDAVKDTIENCQAAEGIFSLNFLSTSGSGYAGHPKKYAGIINEEFMELSLQSETAYGVIIVDFADAELAEKIYMTNFASEE